MTTTMSIDDALAQAVELIAAWDDSASGDEWLGVYAVGAAGARLLAHERMPAAKRAPLTAELRARGVRLGGTCGANPHVWGGDAQRFAVWDDHSCVATAIPSHLDALGTELPVAAITAVTSFLDPRDMGHRGVRVERRAGGPVLIAEEHDASAAYDPTYNRDNLAIDAAWATFLGKALAQFLGVPHQDQLP